MKCVGHMVGWTILNLREWIYNQLYDQTTWHNPAKCNQPYDQHISYVLFSSNIKFKWCYVVPAVLSSICNAGAIFAPSCYSRVSTNLSLRISTHWHFTLKYHRLHISLDPALPNSFFCGACKPEGIHLYIPQCSVYRKGTCGHFCCVQSCTLHIHHQHNLFWFKSILTMPYNKCLSPTTPTIFI